MKATSTRYLKADLIPFDIPLNSGASVTISKASIHPPEPNYAKIVSLKDMINRRTNIRALITDFDETVSHVTFQTGSLGIKIELTIVDSTGYKIQATLWGETAEYFEPQLGKAVILQNALIKSYKQNVTASVDKIMFSKDGQCVELEMWFERCGDEEIEQLTVGPKRKLPSSEYPLVNVSALQTVDNGTTVKIESKIRSVEFAEYEACIRSICKTAVVQMGDDSFCPKCSKPNNTISSKYVMFTLSLSNSTVPINLDHDNAPNFLNLKEFVQATIMKREDIIKSLCDNYVILVTKTRNRHNLIEYVALDFEKIHHSKTKKTP